MRLSIGTKNPLRARLIPRVKFYFFLFRELTPLLIDSLKKFDTTLSVKVLFINDFNFAYIETISLVWPN